MTNENIPPKKNVQLEKNTETLLAEQCFVALSQYKALSQHKELTRQTTGTKQTAATQHKTVFNDLVQLAIGNASIDSKEILANINQSLPLRRAYKQCLLTLSHIHSPAQAAASTDNALPERETHLFKLRFKPDKFNAQQVYGLLTLNQPNEQHLQQGVVLNVELHEVFYQVKFPPVSDNKTQQLFAFEDESLSALLDPESEIRIMAN